MFSREQNGIIFIFLWSNPYMIKIPIIKVTQMQNWMSSLERTPFTGPGRGGPYLKKCNHDRKFPFKSTPKRGIMCENTPPSVDLYYIYGIVFSLINSFSRQPLYQISVMSNKYRLLNWNFYLLFNNLVLWLRYTFYCCVMFPFSSAKFLGCATFFCYATFFRSENFVAQHFIFCCVTFIFCCVTFWFCSDNLVALHFSVA